MKIKAIAPWFGSKRTLAPEIVKELGPHSAYWEPFCGSMAVLLAKPPCPMETVNDLHGDMINLARVIQDPCLGPMLYRELRRTLSAKVFMDEAAERWKQRDVTPPSTEPDIDRAYDYFASSWLGRNGVSGTQSFNQGYARRFTKNGGHAARRWVSAVDSIPQWRRRMREVSILSECGLSILQRIEDAEGVVIYCDPPYLRKGATYVHDADDDVPIVREILGVAPDASLPPLAWHQALRHILGRFRRTRVIVSYYDEPELHEWYHGWTMRGIEVTKALQNQVAGVREKKKATELLLINGPSYVEDAGLFA